MSANLGELADAIFESSTALAELQDADSPALIRRESVENAGRCLQIAEQVRSALSNVSAGERGRVLEVGIGYLSVTTALRLELGTGFDLYGIEHPDRTTLANPYLRRKLDEQAVELATADLLTQALPWPEVLFDSIVFADVIEHLPPTELPRVLTKLATRLKARGHLIITSANLPALYRIVSLAVGRGEVFSPPIPLDWAGQTYGHLRLYGRVDMDILLKHAGLEIVEWQYSNWEHVFMSTDSRSRRLLHWVQRQAPRFAPHLSTSWLVAARRAT
jgi:SAM-dependent methyltransferase